MSTPTLGFLYQTGTILRSPLGSPSRFWQRTFSNSSSRTLRKRPGRHTLAREEQADIAPGFDTSSTLTPGENLKFRAIFEAAAKGLPPPSLQKRAEDKAQSEQEQYRPGIGLDKIFNEAANPRDPQASPASASQSTYTSDDAATSKPAGKAILRELPPDFPAALQGAWRDVRRAMAVDPVHSRNESNAEKEVFQPHILHGADATLREQREADIAKIYGLYNEAQSDFAVWNILEHSVFPRIQTLVGMVRARLRDATKKNASRDVGKKAASKSKKAQTDPKSSTHNEGKEAIAAIIQSTYSVHLLNALRVLRTRFPRSPYALALIPTVKKLDPVSQVLGLSTELYNELLYVLWRQHADIFGCARVVEDMSSQGLVGDRYTTAIYLDAQREHEAIDTNNEVLSAIRTAWWRLPSVQDAMARWGEAMDLLEARAAEEHRYREQWEAEQSTTESYNGDEIALRNDVSSYSTNEPVAQAAPASWL